MHTPVWEAGISIARVFAGGVEFIHECSKRYAPEDGRQGYTPEATDRKIERSSAPWLCDTIRGLCPEVCPAAGCGVRTPADLAAEVKDKADNQARPVDRFIKALSERMVGLRDGGGTAYLRFTDGAPHYWRVNSEAMRNILIRESIDMLDRPLNDRDLREALDAFSVVAWRNPEQQDVCYRKAIVPGTIYLDTGNTEGQFIAVDSRGWRLVGETPAHFRRTGRC